MAKPEQNGIKIGLIGLGSIGRRHARALKALGVSALSAYRTKQGSLQGLENDLEDIKEFTDFAGFMAQGLSGVLICNPTALHIQTLKQVRASAAKLPVFVEKPLATGLDELNDMSADPNVYVGFCLRFHQVINTVKEVLAEGRLGKILKAGLYSGHYLPKWHPYEDYRKAYYARKDLGGGVLRTLCHEIDLAQYFFSGFQGVYAQLSKLSDLEIDVEDNALLLLKMAGEARVNVEIDFLNPTGERCGTIIGEKGKLSYSFAGHQVVLIDQNDKAEVLYQDDEPDPDQMYLDQMRDFLELVGGREFSGCDFAQAVTVNKVIDLAERSNQAKTEIMI